MSDARCHFRIGLTLLAAVAIAGCRSAGNRASEQPPPPSPGSPTSRPADRAQAAPRDRLAPLQMEEKTIPLAQSSVAVTQGPTPLVFIFESAASIRVVDLTTGAQVAAATVQPRTLVRVDDAHGVIVGADNVAPGGLTPGHQYVIYSDPTTPNTISHGVGRPVDVPTLVPKR